ncbi:hypothetical protein KUCAC02_033703 [Chaenocephalus aceratus]|nr:hypothetical protein KUCAC02_033703 [Chaenocephalus aceratus]
MSSSTRNKAPNKQDISKEKNDKQRRPASPASASLTTDSNMCESDHEVTLMGELGKLRKENQEGHNQTKMSLDRLEQTVLDIKVQMGEHEGRIGKLEDRVGMAEDVAVRHQRALRYLIHRDIALSATCDDLQNRLRRNNVRIFQIERAHRSPPFTPHRDPTAPPRHIIVRFLDAAVKDLVIRQAWSQGQVSFQDKRIFFDQDYSPELHKKRAKVHEVIKQLKKEDILARCIYPAQLKLKLGTGEKTYTTLSSAAEVLKGLGVDVRCGERERTEDELKDGWRSSGKKKRDTHSVLFPTERAGHTSLPQYQWGSVTAIVRLLWLIGQVEVQFYVLSVFCNEKLLKGLSVRRRDRFSQTDSRGWTPLHEAAAQRNQNILELTFKASGSVDSRTLRDRLLASLLLQHGAKPDIQDCDLDSPLLVAIRSGRADLVQLLLLQGSSVDKEGLHGRCPLHEASRLVMNSLGH